MRCGFQGINAVLGCGAQDDDGDFPEVKRRGSAGFATQPLALGSPPLLLGPSPTAASTFGTFGPTMRSSYATDTTYPVGSPSHPSD